MAKAHKKTKPVRSAPVKPKLTADLALGNASRLLEWAEGETDLAKMRGYETLADSWLVMSGQLMQRERDA